MNESEFDTLTERVFDAIGEVLDGSDADFDWSLDSGVLQVECPDASKVVINRHSVNREIWVAARSGGQHFRLDGGKWRDTRSGEELGHALARVFGAPAARVLAFEIPFTP